MPQAKEEPTVAELMGELSQDISLLVRQEFQLARTELGEKVSHVGASLSTVVLGGFLAYLGGLALVAALILVLHDVVHISPWVSALIVGAVFAVGGFIAVKGGLTGLKRVDLTPRRTLDTLKDDIQWAKGQQP
jgi:putative superfamily III holin-X